MSSDQLWVKQEHGALIRVGPKGPVEEEGTAPAGETDPGGMLGMKPGSLQLEPLPLRRTSIYSRAKGLWDTLCPACVDHAEGRRTMGQKGQMDTSRLLVPVLLMVGWIV
ncbi:hypothetical protein JZ751_001877, partial [Albula glossodonta]